MLTAAARRRRVRFIIRIVAGILATERAATTSGRWMLACTTLASFLANVIYIFL